MRARRRLTLRILVPFSLGVALFAPLAHAAPAQANLAIIKRWNLGGEGGWDYLAFNPATKRLFVTRQSRVDIVSVDTGTVVGSIMNTQGVHGIAIANGMRRGFTSNGVANSVTMFDLDSLRTLKEAQIPASNPDAILYDRQSGNVYTFNGASNDVTVLDAQSLAVAGRISLPAKPEFAVSDGNGQVFVNIQSVPGRMAVIDTQSLGLKATWPLAGCDSPTGLAIDREHHRLFSVCDAKVMLVTDAQSGKPVTSIAIGLRPDAAVYDARRALVYSSNGEGTLTVIHQDTPDHYTVVQTLATERGARTMALDPDTGNVYLVTANYASAPPPTDGSEQNPRPVPVAGTFKVLVVGTP